MRGGGVAVAAFNVYVRVAIGNSRQTRSVRLERLNKVDLRVGRIFQGGGLSVEAIADVYNVLNVNIPNRADAASLPRVITRLGRRHASEPVIRQINPRGEAIYWIGPAGSAREAGEGTDFFAVSQNRVSITPLQVDLTDHAALPLWHQALVAA